MLLKTSLMEKDHMPKILKKGHFVLKKIVEHICHNNHIMLSMSILCMFSVVLMFIGAFNTSDWAYTFLNKDVAESMALVGAYSIDFLLVLYCINFSFNGNLAIFTSERYREIVSRFSKKQIDSQADMKIIESLVVTYFNEWYKKYGWAEDQIKKGLKIVYSNQYILDNLYEKNGIGVTNVLGNKHGKDTKALKLHLNGTHISGHFAPDQFLYLGDFKFKVVNKNKWYMTKLSTV